MGDAALTVNEALYNFDLIKFYLNFLNLIIDIQLADGSIPDTVPATFGGYPADPNWGTALPTITWQLYRHYNDIQILRDHYTAVRAYVESLRNGYRNTGLAKLAYHYGDWVPPPPQPMTNVYLVASFAFLHDVSLVVNMSQILGYSNDTQAYTDFYQQLAEEFHRVFFTPSANYYADGMQAAQILALALPNVVPANARATVLQHLVQDIQAKGNHLSTGIVSTAQAFPLLSDNGQHDLAVELISSIELSVLRLHVQQPLRECDHSLGIMGCTLRRSRNGLSQSSYVWKCRRLVLFAFSWHWSTSGSRLSFIPEWSPRARNIFSARSTLNWAHSMDSYVFHTRVMNRIHSPIRSYFVSLSHPMLKLKWYSNLCFPELVVWRSRKVTKSSGQLAIRNTNMIEDPHTGLITAHVGSGQYEYQAFWE